MYVKVAIPGEPKGKARPRVTKAGITYTPKETVSYENWVKQCYMNKWEYIFTGQLNAKIDAYYAIPKSASKKRKELMLAHIIRPTKKPDTDNIAKIILDSLNGIAYRDDSQIVSVTINKYYSDNPRVELELWE